MKKFIASIMAAITVLAACLMLVGCGSTGTYYFDSMTMTVAGVSVTVKAGEEHEGVKLDKNSMVIELKSDNKCKVKSSLGSSTVEEDEGTYKIDGKTLTLTIDGDETTATIDGNTITFELYKGTVITLKK